MEQNKLITLPLCQLPIIHPAIFYDDCNGSFIYIKSGTGADYTAAYDVNAAYNKLKGLRLWTKATAPAVDDEVLLLKYIWYPPSKRLRLQLLFTPGISTVDKEIYLGIQTYDGTYLKRAYIKLGLAPDYAAVYVAPGAYQQIPGALWTCLTFAWNYFDLSVDFANSTYKTLALNHQVFDLSLYPFYSIANATSPRAELYIQVITKEANRAILDLAEILITPDLR